jgi:hypothetical protein
LEPIHTLYAVDLFWGAGGLTRGLLDEGIRVLAGYVTWTLRADTRMSTTTAFRSSNGT